MTLPTVQCRNLEKSFGDSAIIRDVSFDVAEGEILALLGPSGCGKTTLLRLLAGFEQADAGEITIGGTPVVGRGINVPPEKRRVGMVFQDYAIFPHLSVLDNVRFGVSGRGSAVKAHSTLCMVGLEGTAEQMPQELSGGQQQRVALARALAPEPAILLLDEPFSNLDASLRQVIRQEVRMLLKNSGSTAIFVTHDQEEALYLGDKIAVMHEGRIEQLDTPETVFHAPCTAFVAQFMGQSDFIEGVVADGGIETSLGRVFQATGLPDATVVQLAVHTDDVILSVAGEGNATIVDRQFTGTDNVYTVKLDDGCLIRSRQPHTLVFRPNSPILATLTADHPIPVFHQGHAV